MKGVDQHDVMVHHDAGQRQHTGARHDDGEGLSHYHHAEKRADHRQNHGHQNQRRVIEAVEQRQKHDRDQEQRQKRRLDQEGAGFILLFVRAFEFHPHVGRYRLLRDPAFQLRHLLTGQQRFGHAIRFDRFGTLRPHIGTHVIDTMAIDPFDGVDLRRRHFLDEIADRDNALCGRDAQGVERVNAAIFGRIAHPDVDFVVGVIGSVFADQNAIGHKLHRGADGLRVGVEPARQFAVDVEVPLDAGQRAGIFHVAQLRLSV